ncbi:MAG: GNAT family N-acetyltransferase [Cyclobacteriaceae bacterium]|nr:GNAT family N-acetyltransferase [Cyclobacteriaceae bacterium]
METSQPEIRRATPVDFQRVRQFLIDTFTDTFGADNEPGNMAYFLSTAYSAEALGKEWNEEGYSTWLALTEQTLVGVLQVRINHEAEDQLGRNTLEIQRLYVSAAAQGTGVGAALMRTAIDHATAAGVDWLWLGVWEKNFKAQAFYKRWGFEPFGTHIFAMKDDLQTDWLMRRRIQSID